MIFKSRSVAFLISDKACSVSKSVIFVPDVILTIASVAPSIETSNNLE